MSGDYEIVGGASGLAADLDDMDATGSRISGTGWDVGAVALETHKFLVDPNLLTSAVLAPGSFASFQASLLGALDGPGGLSANAVRMSAAGLAMQAKANGYRATDAALEFVADIHDHQQGLLFGALLLNPATGPGMLGAASLYLWRDGAFDDPQRWLTDHPDVLETIVARAPGTLSWLLPMSGFPANTEQASALLALLYDQGGATVRTDGPYDTTAPSDLGEALDKLMNANKGESQFVIERVGTGDSSAYTIYLPGTKEFDAPWAPSELVQNLGTNFAGVAGSDNAYEAALLQAMQEAGIPPGAEVNLMGHSQGGIIAARMAEKVTDPESGYPQYNVTSVVTAGSPVDHIDLPDRIRVLSLANEHDIVPTLDGEGRRDRSNHTTVVTDLQTGSVVGNHSLEEVYLPMAQDLAAAAGTPGPDNAPIRDALAPLSAFLAGGDSVTWTFEMERD